MEHPAPLPLGTQGDGMCMFPTQAESMTETRMLGGIAGHQAPRSQARLITPRSHRICKEEQSIKGSGFQSELVCSGQLPKAPQWVPKASRGSDLAPVRWVSGGTFSKSSPTLK